MTLAYTHPNIYQNQIPPKRQLKLEKRAVPRRPTLSSHVFHFLVQHPPTKTNY